MPPQTIEERLAALELEVAKLKQAQATKLPAEPWWHKIVGVYKDDPAYEEAMRLGREWRESEEADSAQDDPA